MIRPAILQDMPYLYRICLKTALGGKDAAGLFSDEALPGHYYAAPYLAYDRQFCFIAAEEIGPDLVPCGYIVGAADSPAFYQWLHTEWLPPLRRQYPFLPAARTPDSERLDPRYIALLHRNPVEKVPSYFEEYPAHLHINLLDGCQGKGLGRALMTALLTALGSANVDGTPGVHLGVARANTGAIAFYTALGFTTLEETPGTLFMGKKLTGLREQP